MRNEFAELGIPLIENLNNLRGIYMLFSLLKEIDSVTWSKNLVDD